MSRDMRDLSPGTYVLNPDTISRSGIRTRPASCGERRDPQRPPPALIAYLLGAIGTSGSGIWAMWLIRWVHWLAESRLEISVESRLFRQYSGVYVKWMRLAWSGSSTVLHGPL